MSLSFHRPGGGDLRGGSVWKKHEDKLLTLGTANAARPGGRARPGSQDAPSPGGDLTTLILTSLENDKAEDVVPIDLAGKSTMADAMVIASGRSHRHVAAMSDHLARALKEAGLGSVRIEGLPHCDWVLIDAGDVVVHLFRPEVRAFYNLEKIWGVTAPEPAAV